MFNSFRNPALRLQLFIRNVGNVLQKNIQASTSIPSQYTQIRHQCAVNISSVSGGLQALAYHTLPPHEVNERENLILNQVNEACGFWSNYVLQQKPFPTREEIDLSSTIFQNFVQWLQHGFEWTTVSIKNACEYIQNSFMSTCRQLVGGQHDASTGGGGGSGELRAYQSFVEQSIRSMLGLWEAVDKEIGNNNSISESATLQNIARQEQQRKNELLDKRQLFISGIVFGGVMSFALSMFAK